MQTHFLASLSALTAAFSSSVFSSAGASVDMKRVLSGCCCLVIFGITVDVGTFRKAVAKDGPKLPTARRTPAEDKKRSIGVVDETMDLPAV